MKFFFNFTDKLFNHNNPATVFLTTKSLENDKRFSETSLVNIKIKIS